MNKMAARADIFRLLLAALVSMVLLPSALAQDQFDNQSKCSQTANRKPSIYISFETTVPVQKGQQPAARSFRLRLHNDSNRSMILILTGSESDAKLEKKNKYDFDLVNGSLVSFGYPLVESKYPRDAVHQSILVRLLPKRFIRFDVPLEDFKLKDSIEVFYWVQVSKGPLWPEAKFEEEARFVCFAFADLPTVELTKQRTSPNK